MFKLFTDDLRKAVSTAVAESRGFDLKDDLFTYELRLTATELIAENGKVYIVTSAANDHRSVNAFTYYTDVETVKDHETLVSVFEIEAEDDLYKVEDISWIF